MRYNEYGWLGYFSLLVQATIPNHTYNPFEFMVYTFSEEINKLKTGQNGLN
jgi:hypothetical protein